jgi:hypothetical protein
MNERTPLDQLSERLGRVLTPAKLTARPKRPHGTVASRERSLPGTSVRCLPFLATPAVGSRLLFSYVRRDFIDGRNRYGAHAAYHDFVVKRWLWKFGLDPGRVADFRADYGWREIEQVGRQEFLTRYGRPAASWTSI